ncbi:discoidin domain-containing protein [Streptomyces avicenniae]|uniref:discoidin domain-containing protein n=1 Tax=Streptomyces avicenniae TaxID=500153 RepID=UPI00069B9DA3|nr:discoidin domain-containing protein [Streptomyces avicenniae]
MLAAPLALAAASQLGAPGSAFAQTTAVRAAAAARPTDAQRWDALRAKLAGIEGVWTNQAYAGGVNNAMPDTALLGNGDVGVTSGGSEGVKTFRISKGDFWNGNPRPIPAAIGGTTLGPATAQPGGNLALGAAATASSSDGAFPPARAVNGEWGSGYEGWVSQVGKPQWIRLDLRAEQTIARWVVRNDEAARPGNGAHNTRNVTLQVSSDGTTWRTIDTVTGNTAAVIQRDVTATRARYVRLNITEPTQSSTPDTTQNPRARIGQIELYAQPGGNQPPSRPFRETQQIVDGDINTEMYIGDTQLSLVTRLAANSNILITSVTSRGSQAVRLQSSTWAGAATARPEYTNTSGVDGATMWAQRTTAPGSNWVSRAALATRILGGASVETPRASGATASVYFTLQPGATAHIITAIAGGGRNPANPAADARALVAAQAVGTIATLDTERVAWWRDYWMRSDVHLGDAALERFYYPAQYFIGSSARAGKVAPGLYGLWTTTDYPQFSGDYHLNYNAQAPFYGVYSSNRPELSRPFHQVIMDYVPEARRRAREDLRRVKSDYVGGRFPSGGVPGGVLFPVGIGPWGSTTDDQYHQQVSNALFSASQFVEYYEYTQDRTFLRDQAYPFLVDVATFFEHYLEYDAAAGRYRLWSGPHEGTWGQDSSADIGLLKQVYGAVISGSQTLGVDSGRRATWQNILNRLPEQATIVRNGTTVYSLVRGGTMQGDDTRDFRPGDNTINLEFVHPGDVLGITSAQAQRQIGISTLDAMNSWGQNNSFPKVFTQAARVGYPAQSLIDRFKTVISTRTAANLRITDPYHGIEKSGTTEAINNMLVQGHGGVITLFPVWPSARDASFNRLRMPGAFVVSSARQGGAVLYADVVSQVGGTLRLTNAWPGRTIAVTNAAGQPVSFTTTGGVITVQTAAGQTYRVDPV